MIIDGDMPNKFFRLDNLAVSDELKACIIDFASSYKDTFRWYGKIRKRLYMYRITTDEMPALKEIYNKFIDKTIVDSFEIMLCEPGCILAPHTDTDRYAAINIPISGNFDKSYVSFFEDDGTGRVNITHEKEPGVPARSAGKFFDKNPPLIGNVVYKNPICINVEEVHNATNAGNDKRILLSIGTGNVKFHQLEKLNTENNLIA